MYIAERARGAWALTADPGWDRMTRTQSPLADAAWIESFVEAFAPASYQLHEVRREGEIVAAFPTVRTGRLARAFSALENEHHPSFLVSGALDEATAEQLLRHLLARADYLFLTRLSVESTACVALRAAAARLRLPTALIETAGSGDARIRLTSPWNSFRATLPKNLQRDLPRKRRQLEKLGRLEYQRIVEPGPALEAALTESYDVETRGWKGTHGSPIGRDPATLRFYDKLAGRLAAAARFALYVLRLDGAIIAFEYALRGGGHIEMLKLSFDPAFEKQSPGQVLRLMLLQDEVERGEIDLYHLGRPSEWKLRWANEVAPLCSLRIYAPTLRGRAAYLAGPVLRGRLKASPAAAAARSALLGVRDQMRARLGR